ncbi:MAG: phosphatase PAP2 family protein [Bacteroidales bacterium]
MEEFLKCLKDLDTSLLLFINGHHNEFFDFLMFWLSDRIIWVPFYLFLIYLLFRHFGKTSWWILLGVLLMILISDQVSVHLFKNQFQRLRPCHEPALEGMIHLVKGKCGGSFGFISSHAANTFSLAVFLFGFFWKKMPLLAWGMLVWAAAISYSRVYLGVHYPGDVVAGAIFGGLAGWGFYLLTCSWINTRKHGL